MKPCSGCLLALELVLFPSESQASLTVNILATPGAGFYQYEVSIENGGSMDFVSVSLIDAPLSDPLIDASLAVPDGFIGSYDSGFGIVDFLEDTERFAAGTTHTGFVFHSLSSPEANFREFQAMTTDGSSVVGSTTIVSPPFSPSFVFVDARFESGQLALYFSVGEPIDYRDVLELQSRSTIGTGKWGTLAATLEGPDTEGRYRYLTSVPGTTIREYRIKEERL